jgi:hypothetical protein
MSAGTQGFTDTRQDTNHIGSVISRILEARQLAEDERKYAEAQADKYQTSLEEAGVKRGDFFKKALRWKFGGEFKQKKLSQLNTWKKRGDLLKSAATGKSGRNKLNKIERSQALFDMFKASDKPKTFRDKFKPLYEGFVDDPMVRPMSQLVKPGTAKKIQKATTSRSNKRVSKEDILNSISSITDAIEKIAESISEKNRIVSDQMIHSSVLQGMIHAQLKSNGDSLEDKLQKIVDAISNQTQYQTKAVSKAKSRDAENKLEAQKDAAGVVSFDDLTTEEDESKVPERPMGGYPELSQMGHAGMDVSHLVPKAEQGAILSGPDSGYLAELHGNEMVVPLDNNYTQGEPSAVDGKVRPRPTEPIAKPKSMPSNNIQKFETGTKNNIFNTFPKFETGTNDKPVVSSSPITSKFGFNTARNQMGIAGGGTTQQSKMTQSMVDVMSLPMMAAGGTILAATTKYMQSLGGEGANISPEIQRVSRPIAETFGLPPSIVNKAKQGSTSKSSSVGKPDEEGGEPSKNIFAKLMDGFGAMLDKMKDSINTTPPPGPGTTGPGVDFSGNKPSVEVPVQQKVMDQFESTQNWSTYRETIASKESSGSYDPTPGRGGGAGGQYEGRYQINHAYLADIAGKLGEATPTREQFRADPKMQERFMQEYTMDNRRILEAYSPKFKKMTKKEQMAVLAYAHSQGAGAAAKWVESGMGEGTADQFGTKGTWYYENVSKNLEKMGATATPNPSPTGQLGQAITNNYGLKVGKERTFTVPGYGEVTAHKTTVGFDFFKDGRRLDVSPSNPQGKTIVDHFKKTNGGQTISPPEEKIVSSLSPQNNSESGNIAVLNIGGGGGSPTSNSGSVSQPSGEDGTERGIHPLGPFGATSEYATIINNTG